jgi:hypothetical protein
VLDHSEHHALLYEALHFRLHIPALLHFFVVVQELLAEHFESLVVLSFLGADEDLVLADSDLHHELRGRVLDVRDEVLLTLFDVLVAFEL